MASINRRAYAETYGPTVGDRVRLADTGLLIEVEQDHTLLAGAYGEEVKFGGGKTIRDGMAQSQRTRLEGAVDCVMTNALILDHWGIVKCDIGLKDGRIVGIVSINLARLILSPLVGCFNSLAEYLAMYSTAEITAEPLSVSTSKMAPGKPA